MEEDQQQQDHNNVWRNVVTRQDLSQEEMIDFLDSMDDDPDNETIMLVCERGLCQVLSFLIQTKKAKVNLPNPTGGTALASAARHGQSQVARILLDHGANVNSLDHTGTSPLEAAFNWNHIDVARLLLEYGAQISQRIIDRVNNEQRLQGDGSIYAHSTSTPGQTREKLELLHTWTSRLERVRANFVNATNQNEHLLIPILCLVNHRPQEIYIVLRERVDIVVRHCCLNDQERGAHQEEEGPVDMIVQQEESREEAAIVLHANIERSQEGEGEDEGKREEDDFNPAKITKRRRTE